MMKNKTTHKSIALLLCKLSHLAKNALFVMLAILCLFSSNISLAAVTVLAGWDVHSLTGGANNFGVSPLAASTADINLTVGGLSRGSGVGTTGTAAAGGWGGTSWVTASASAAIAANDVVTFTLAAKTGYQVSFSSISKFGYRRSGTGATLGVLQYQIGAGSFTDISTLNYSSTSASGASIAAIDLSGVAALQNIAAGTIVTFRIANYAATGAGGTWYIFDVASSTAADFEISGTITATTASQDGACGSSSGQSLPAAPTSNLCSVGVDSAVTGSGTSSDPWAWTCAGSNGGNTASCSATSSDAGVCL